MLLRAMSVGAVWIYTVHTSPQTSQVAAYVYTARPTSNTVQIRQLFVLPACRRKGIANRILSQISQKHLTGNLSSQTDYSIPLQQDPETKWGPKREICFLVDPADQDARRVYECVVFSPLAEYCSYSLA